MTATTSKTINTQSIYLSQELRICEQQVNALSSTTVSPSLPFCLIPSYIICLVLKCLFMLQANPLLYHVPCYAYATAPSAQKETTSYSSLVLSCWGSTLKSHFFTWDPESLLPPWQFGYTGPWRLCREAVNERGNTGVDISQVKHLKHEHTPPPHSTDYWIKYFICPRSLVKQHWEKANDTRRLNIRHWE